jgi:hypothetical protein
MISNRRRPKRWAVVTDERPTGYRIHGRYRTWDRAQRRSARLAGTKVERVAYVEAVNQRLREDPEYRASISSAVEHLNDAYGQAWRTHSQTGQPGADKPGQPI